jgi:hypothetical protein
MVGRISCVNGLAGSGRRSGRSIGGATVAGRCATGAAGFAWTPVGCGIAGGEGFTEVAPFPLPDDPD